MQVIDHAVATEDICEDWPAIPAATPLQFQGLSLLTGYECPVCTVIHPGFKSLQNHARQSHSVTLPSNGRYQICDCQQLSKHPAARSWFPVHRYAPPPVTSFSPYLSTLREQLDIPAVIPFSEVDHRQVNPWQATTRWGEWVATQDPALLMQLVEYPKPDSDLANLGPIVQRFLNRVYNFIPVAGELCCQILNTETPTRYICIDRVLYRVLTMSLAITTTHRSTSIKCTTHSRLTAVLLFNLSLSSSVPPPIRPTSVGGMRASVT